MEVFDGRKAAQEYMSRHTLAFSTPELTLVRFAFWLGEPVPDPAGGEKAVPRLYSFVEEKDFEPVQVVDDDTYVPSGAVKTSSMYGAAGSEGGRFCAECGSSTSDAAKFCPQCGTAR